MLHEAFMFVSGIITGIFGWHMYARYKVAKAFKTIDELLPKMREAIFTDGYNAGHEDRAAFDIENKRVIEKNETKH